MLGSALILAACASTAGREAPAVLTQPSAQTGAELVRVVSAALNVASVTVAADALIRDSLLVIERTSVHDANGRRAQGRELGRPEQFQLLLVGKRCVLLHVRTGVRYELAGVSCGPSPASTP